MSASPAGGSALLPNGAPATTAPGGPPGAAANGAPKPPLKRRPKPSANPLVQASRRPRPRLGARPTASGPQANGGIPGRPRGRSTPLAEGPRDPSPDPPGAQEFSIVTTKRQLREQLRYHIMRFQAPNNRIVELENEDQFTRPVRLHRRDPQAPAMGAGASDSLAAKEEEAEEDKERAKLEAAKAERRRQREEAQKNIAPSSKKRRQNEFSKKTEQVHQPNDTPEAQKRQRLRYEEAMPWHLEDFDNKNTWVGRYEAGLSERHVMLIPDPNGRTMFSIQAVEKFYKFNPKSDKRTMNKGQIDEKATVGTKIPRWVLDTHKQAKIKEEEAKKSYSGMFTRAGGRDEESAIKGEDAPKVEVAPDADDIDFNLEEEFADDEEGVNGLFEGDDEEKKDAEERLKRDQLAAPTFDFETQEAEIFKEEEDQEERQKKEEELKKMSKKIRKALLKREKNIAYESDSDENPYASSSESSIDDEELARQEEEAKKAAEAAKTDPSKANPSKPPSTGASSKGTNTPSGRPSKHPNRDTGLKRPGSPNLSEASGTESTRKKQKKKHDGLNTSGYGSSAETSRKSSMGVGKLRGAGSGSDSEATDSGKIKLKIRARSSQNGTPSGSRAGSPNPPSATAQPGTSRAGSPTGSQQVRKPIPHPAVPADAPLPTSEEILAVVPPQGLTIQGLTQKFRGRVHQEKMKDFIRLIRTLLAYDNTTKLLSKKIPAA